MHSCLRIIYHYKPLDFYFILFGDGDQTQALGILGKCATQVMPPTRKDLIEYLYSRLAINFHSAVRDEAVASPWPVSFLPCDVGGTHDLLVGWMRHQWQIRAATNMHIHKRSRFLRGMRRVTPLMCASKLSKILSLEITPLMTLKLNNCPF